VLQFGQLVPDLRLVDNVALPLLLDGRPVDVARAAAREWLHRVELGEHTDAVPRSCPPGRRSAAPWRER
jgi:putative ABC transport system ATP-binding protein